MRVVLTLLVFLAAPVFPQQDAVLEAEFDVVLTIGQEQYRSQGTARVDDNQVIAVEFREHKIELKVSLLDADKFMVETSIFEGTDKKWVRLENDDSGGFGGNIGSFSTFNWNGDGIRLNMAITVSIADQQN